MESLGASPLLKVGARVLILDPDWPQTSFLVVELYKAGFDVTLASPTLVTRMGLGRYCRAISMPDVSSDEYQDALEAVLRSGLYELIFPTSEEITRKLWPIPDQLTKKVFPQLNSQQRDAIQNRHRARDVALAAGLRVPNEMPLNSETDVTQAAKAYGLPLVIRGTQGISGNQVRILRDLSSAHDAYSYIATRSPDVPYAQEFIAGPRCLVGGLFQEGRAMQLFAQQTTEMQPSETGPSIRVKSKFNETLLAYGQRLFESLKWNGLACAEFIAQSDNDFMFLEFNPRPWAAIGAASLCGISFFSLFAQYLSGAQSIKPSRFNNDVDCPLFPQYLLARIRSRQFWRLHELPSYFRSLQAAPWRHPFLMHHLARTMWWAFDHARKKNRLQAE